MQVHLLLQLSQGPGQLPCRKHGGWKAATHVVQPWKALKPELGSERSNKLAEARGGLQLRIPLPPLRFFLLSPEETRQIYQPEQLRYVLWHIESSIQAYSAVGKLSKVPWIGPCL